MSSYGNQVKNNSQTNQNTTTNAPNPTSTSTQTSNPIYIPQQPSIIPPTTVPEPTVIINLEISINSTEGTVKANKPLKECFLTGGRHSVHDVALSPGRGVTNGGTICFVGGNSPDWTGVTGYVVDFDGQERSFSW